MPPFVLLIVVIGPPFLLSRAHLGVIQVLIGFRKFRHLGEIRFWLFPGLLFSGCGGEAERGPLKKR